MSKIKVLILCLLMFVLSGWTTGWSTEKQYEIMNEFDRIPSSGFTCSYTHVLPKLFYAHTGGGTKIFSQELPLLTPFTLHIRYNLENDSSPIEVYSKTGLIPPQTFDYSNPPDKVMQLIYINDSPLYTPSWISIDAYVIYDILSYYHNYQMCKPNFPSYLGCKKDYNIFDPDSITCGGSYDVIGSLNISDYMVRLFNQSEIKHNSPFYSQPQFDYNDFDQKKTYCVLLNNAEKDVPYYSALTLYRSNDNKKKAFRFDPAGIMCNTNGSSLGGEVYPIKDINYVEEYRFPKGWLHSDNGKEIYLNEGTHFKIPEEQIPLLFPKDKQFPRYIYFCDLKKQPHTLYADPPEEGRKEKECQKSKNLSYEMEAGYNSSGNNLVTASNCEGIFGSLTNEIQGLFNLLKIIAPILILVLSTFDFVKATITQDKDESKLAFNKLIKRLLLAVLLFLLPIILNLILDIAGLNLEDPLCSIR